MAYRWPGRAVLARQSVRACIHARVRVHVQVRRVDRNADPAGARRHTRTHARRRASVLYETCMLLRSHTSGPSDQRDPPIGGGACVKVNGGTL